MLIHVDEEDEEIVFNKSGELPLGEFEDALWAIKDVAKEYMYRTTIRDYGKSIKPKDFSYQTKKKEEMDEVHESAMSGSKRTSRQMIEDVLIVVKHKKDVDDSKRGSRSLHKNISKISLEKDGEKYEFPSKDIQGARALARHMSKGGQPTDVIGESIISMTHKLKELREFYAYTKHNKLISEDTADIIENVRSCITNISHDLRSVAGKRTYESASQRIAEQNSMLSENEDGTDYKSMFTVKSFDEKFESVLPMVSGIVQENNMKQRRLEESSLNPVKTKSFRSFSGNGIVYESEAIKFGHKLAKIAENIKDNDELSGFMKSVSEKLVNGKDINAFESAITKNVLENLEIATETSVSKDCVMESMNSFEQRLVLSEQEAYDDMQNEGIRDIVSTAAGKFKEFFRNANDELLDLGTRLKRIQGIIQSDEVSEASELMTAQDKKNPSAEVFKRAAKKFMGARAGLGIANKLKDKSQKSKHQSQIMRNMNALRRDIEWLENFYELSKKERPKKFAFK
jgi:hypothetical protein